MKKIIYILLAFVPSLLLGQTTSENYQKETIYKVPVQQAGLPNVFIDDKIETITYFDGLGRTKQTVNSRSGGQLQNVTQHIGYDRFGRQQKGYLPVPSDNVLGTDYLDYVDPTTLLSDINGYYNTEKYENTQNPYSQTRFEPSPLSRPMETTAPGTPWLLDATSDTDHTMK